MAEHEDGKKEHWQKPGGPEFVDRQAQALGEERRVKEIERTDYRADPTPSDPRSCTFAQDDDGDDGGYLSSHVSDSDGQCPGVRQMGLENGLR